MLPIEPPFEPMEALLVESIPTGPWQYEPKWDGFRCLAFRDAGDVELQSKSGRPLARYFPDMVAALQELRARQFVLDGELVIPIGGALDFEELQLRLHPAASRVQRLAAEHPSVYVLFDILVDARGELLTSEPLEERRARLEAFAAEYIDEERIKLSPATRELEQARRWFAETGGSLDGVIAKRLDLPYQTGTRNGMQKIKNIRAAECVVGGFRYASRGKIVGSLLLGLYGDDGLLHHVGFTSNLPAAERERLTAELPGLQQKRGVAVGFSGRAPGGPSRWSSERSGEWEPLPNDLVVEVTFDHFTGGRFRHGTGFKRWRPDKAPAQCRMEQVAGQGSLLPLL